MRRRTLPTTNWRRAAWYALIAAVLAVTLALLIGPSVPPLRLSDDVTVRDRPGCTLAGTEP